MEMITRQLEKNISIRTNKVDTSRTSCCQQRSRLPPNRRVLVIKTRRKVSGVKSASCMSSLQPYCKWKTFPPVQSKSDKSGGNKTSFTPVISADVVPSLSPFPHSGSHPYFLTHYVFLSSLASAQSAVFPISRQHYGGARKCYR